jgi:outer membrane immunogenic protein
MDYQGTTVMGTLKMKLFSGIWGLTLTSVVALVSAHAADMYRAPEGASYKDEPAPYVSWAGFYAGVNGGYGWSKTIDDSVTVVQTVANNTGVIPLHGLSPNGGFGGSQIGYNWEGAILGPRVILGIEADIQGADIKDTSSTTGAVVVGGTSNGRVVNASQKYDLDYFGTIRGRLGYAFERALLYATGGFAYGGVDTSTDVTVPADGDHAHIARSRTETGYAIGGGVEYNIAPRWTLKAEYQYIDLGSDKASGVFVTSPQNFGHISSDNAFNTVRAGINYHVGTAYEPLK